MYLFVCVCVGLLVLAILVSPNVLTDIVKYFDINVHKMNQLQLLIHFSELRHSEL